MPLRSTAPNSAKLCVGGQEHFYLEGQVSLGILLRSFDAMALPDTASNATNTTRFSINRPSILVSMAGKNERSRALARPFDESVQGL